MKSLAPKQLFLLDGIGALVSAGFLGIVLVQLEANIGMPVNFLYVLAGLVLVFAIYSLSCHFLFPTNWRFYLRLIAIINLSYCTLTLTLVLFHLDQLTSLGITYFVIEILIILVLVRAEWRCSALKTKWRVNDV